MDGVPERGVISVRKIIRTSKGQHLWGRCLDDIRGAVRVAIADTSLKTNWHFHDCFCNISSHVIMMSIDGLTCFAPQHMVLNCFSIRGYQTIQRLPSLPLVFQVNTIDCCQSETDDSMLMVFVIVYVLLADVTLHTIIINILLHQDSLDDIVQVIHQFQLLLCFSYYLKSIIHCCYHSHSYRAMQKNHTYFGTIAISTFRAQKL